MHDIKAIRDNPEAFDRHWSAKGRSGAAAEAVKLDAQRLMAEVETLKGVMATAAEEQELVGGKLKDLLASLPNIPAPEVPVGEDEAGNVEQRRWGDAAKLPAGKLNKPKDHVDLGAALGGMDFEAAARMSGARFVVL